MCITNGREFGGTPNILVFWLFLDNLSISEQTIDTELYNYDSMKKKKIHLIFTTYIHVPKLSIGFNTSGVCVCVCVCFSSQC